MFEISIVLEIEMFEISFSVGLTTYSVPSTDYITTDQLLSLNISDLGTSINLVT